MTPVPELNIGGLMLSGKYRVEAFLGQGAFARVYRAHHLELKVDRAVKVVSRDTPGVGSTVLDDFRARFRQEAQLGARLDHPHVIRIYDFEEAEGRLCLVMEYAAGGSLAGRLREQGTLPVAEAVRLTLEAAAGLEALHGLGAVHRDVKPSNLLLDAGGHIRLADLGLTQLPGGLSQRSMLGSQALPHPGTPEYMSPEQETTSGFLTASSDVYSLGCVLFELLTGRLWKQAMADVEDVRELRPEVPAGVAAALARMLCQQPGQRKSDAADPAKRYVTMGGVRQALQEAQRVEEQQARWRQLYQQGKDALARHDYMAGIAALQSLLAEAPGYADAAALLADARAAQHRQEVIEQLTGQARQQQRAGDWAGLEETARQLQRLSEPAARAFLEALAAKEQARAARRAHLWEQGKRALELHDYAEAIASLQGLLAEAPDYRDAACLLADARAAAQRQQTIEELMERARRLQLAGDWPNLHAVVQQLQPLSEHAARPFAEALAAEEQRQRDEAARRERERQAAEAARHIPSEPIRTAAQSATRRRSASHRGCRRTLVGLYALTFGLLGIIAASPQMREWVTRLMFPPSYTSTPEPPAGATWVREADGMTMVYVPAGEFLMGSTDAQVEQAFQLCKAEVPDCSRDWFKPEHPQHRVDLGAFWIDRTEVTNTQYGRCVEADACLESLFADDSELNAGDQPVVSVDWSEAQDYCQWVGGGLPSEAEWEKAARGQDGRKYPWGNQDATCQYAVMDDGSGGGCGRYRTWPVGSKPEGASPYGALDMAGNAWEWVADWYAADYYTHSPEGSPRGPDSGQYRGKRGGSWGDRRSNVRSAFRDADAPSVTIPDIGFRCRAYSTSSQ